MNDDFYEVDIPEEEGPALFHIDYEQLEKSIGPAKTEAIKSLAFCNNMRALDFEELNKLAAGAVLLGLEPITSGGGNMTGALFYFTRPDGDAAAIEINQNIFTGVVSFEGGTIK